MTDTQLIERPQKDTFKPVDQVQTIEEALKNRNVITRFQQIVPKHLSPERMIRVCALAVYKTPLLAKCETMSLLGAMLSLADLGLEPNTPLQHAFLIPFKARRKNQAGQWEDYYQVQVVLGYRGLLDLAYRGGMLVTCHADVAYQPDFFEFEYGDNAHLKHIPSETGDHTSPKWAYAYAKLSDGFAFEVLPYPLVRKVRDDTQSYRMALSAREQGNTRQWETCPWVKYEHEMAQKTMIRRMAKNLHQSIEFARAVELDDLSESGAIDYTRMVRQPEALENFAALPTDDPEPVQDAPKKATKPKTEKKTDAPPPPPPQPETTPDPPPEHPDREHPPAEVEGSQVVYAFTLVMPDGDELPYEDPLDFRKAYLSHMDESAQRFGLPGLDGYYETNRPTFLKWAESNKTEAVELERYYAAVRKAMLPAIDDPKPATPAGSDSRLF